MENPAKSVPSKNSVASSTRSPARTCDGVAQACLASPVSPRRRQSELARDFVQQTLEQVYRELDAYRGDGAFLSWATTIALRFAGQELRRAHWQTQRFDPTKGERSPVMARIDGNQLPENQVIAGEIQRAVKRAIEDDMSEQQQRVFIARFVQARTYDEIATAEGISTSAAYQRVHQARLKVKNRLRAAGFEAWELA